MWAQLLLFYKSLTLLRIELIITVINNVNEKLIITIKGNKVSRIFTLTIRYIIFGYT